MLVEYLIVAAGIVIILALANIIMNNSLQISKHYGLSGTFIGLTLLSIGTSVPEIMTHVVGSVNILKNPETINTFSGLLIGTNVGSDIFQQNFVLAIVGLIGTIVVIRKKLFAEMGGLIAASLLLWLVSLGGFISRVEGLFLVLAYIGYLIYLERYRINEEYLAVNHLNKKQITLAFVLILFSFGMMAFVSEKVLESSKIIVSSLPISASFFGVVLLGIASALPELTTSIIAILKGKRDISAGILIGSNITNPLFGVGVGALISTYTVPDVIVFFDLPFKIVTAFLILYFLIRNEKLNKWEAITLVILYLVYLFVRQIFFPTDF